MHIPDGFIAPQVYLPAYALAAGAWWWAARDLREGLEQEQVPRLAVLTALAYAVGLVMVPVPGGTSGHAIGVALLALIFGQRLAFLAYSLALLLQSLLFGAGGITALPVNALAMGLIGSFSALWIFRLLRGSSESLAVVAAAWGSVVLSALAVALVLGIQPAIAHQTDGTPLYFPFGLTITLSAVIFPHLIIGAGEAVLTLFVWRFAKSRKWVPG